MSLTGKQTQVIANALLDAYSQSSLAIMVLTQMNVRLDTITRNGTFTEVVYGLIDWVDQAGRVQELIEVAHAENPSNAKLAELYADSQEWTYAESSPPARPSATVTHDKIIYGDEVGGDKFVGDKITTGDLEGTAIAVGAGAKAIYQGLTIEEVNSLFAEWREAETVPVWDGRTPYVGLNAFQESDAEFFFGRESLVDDLLARIKSSNFITISGPSGSGKSSVARAGLLHALRSGRLERSDTWLLAVMQPRGNPIEQLALAMGRLTQSPTTQTHLLETAASDPQALSNQAELLLSDDPRQRFVLLVDQFEEAFTQTKDEVIRTNFINLLTHAAEVENGRVIVVLSLRSDFISHCTRFSELRALMSKELQLVGAMEPAKLAKAIAMPAITVGAGIDSALVKTILDDMKGEPGALPLMSFALRDLFDAQKTQIGKSLDITLQEYLDRGGIEKALERHASRVFDEFTPQQQKLAEGIFSRLVEIGEGRVDTRRTAAFAELIPKEVAADEVAAVVQKLAQENTRLVTTDSVVGEKIIAGTGAGSTTMTLAHERLIDAWPWLRRLVDDNRAMIGLLNQIDLDAQRWEQETDEGFLYRGGRLLQVEEMLEQFKPNLNELSAEFIETSQQRRHEAIEREKEVRRRDLENQRRIAEEQRLRAEENERANANLRRRAVLLTLAGIIALAMAVAAGWFGIDANQQRSVANVQRDSAEGHATQAAFNLSTATVALTTSEAAQATAVWNESEAQRQASIAQARQLAAQSASKLSNNQYEPAILLAIESGREHDVLEAFSAIRSVIAHPWHAITTLDGHANRISQATWSEDESRILTSSWDNTIRIWDAKRGKELTILDGHTSIVWQAIWSMDESKILTSSYDNTARIWDAKTGEALTIFEGHTGIVWDAIWSMAERKVLTSGEDGTARIWDADSGEELTLLRGHQGIVTQAIWSMDESKILTTSEDGTARIWDAESGEELTLLRGHQGIVTQAIWSMDESKVLTSSRDNTAKLWDSNSGQELASLQGHMGWVNWATWNTDETKILTSGDDGTVRIWEVETGQEVIVLGNSIGYIQATWNLDESKILAWGQDGMTRIWDAKREWEVTLLQGHTDRVLDATWSDDESRVLTRSDDGTARVWDAENGEQLVLLNDHMAPVSQAIWSMDESMILTGGNDGKVRVWSTTAAQELTLIQGHKNWAVSQATWSADESKILTSSDDDTARIWDTKSGQELTILPNHTSRTIQATWSADESKILTVDKDYTIRIWDSETGQELMVLKGHTKWAVQARWSTDESKILTIGEDNTARSWDSKTGEALTLTFLQGHTRVINQGAWNADESKILTSSADGTARVWDVDGGHELTRLDGHDGSVLHSTWNADENKILTSSIDDTARVWNAETGEELAALEGHTDGVLQAEWSADESKILTSSADGTARIWDAEIGEELATIEGHTDSVLQAEWSGDGSKVLTSSADSTARIWDAETGEELATLEGHTGSVLQAEWSADGSKILTSSADGTMRIWYVHMTDLLVAACDWVPRNFTWVEWNRYMSDSGQAYRPTCPQVIIPLDAIEGIQSEARQQILDGDIVSATERLEQLNGWLQVNGQFESRGIDIEAFVSEALVTPIP